MLSKFKVDKGRLQKILSIVSFRDKLQRRVLNFTPEGLVAFENSSSSAFAIVKCSQGFFEEAPDNNFSMIVSDGFLAGLANMASGVISFTVDETGQGKSVIRMAEQADNAVEKTTYEEPVQIPVGDEGVFPIETGRTESGTFELKMKAPKALVVEVEAIKLQDLHKTNIERYRMIWKPDGTLVVTVEFKDGGTLKKVVSVKYVTPPTEDVLIDVEPKLFQSQLSNFTGDVRLCVHIGETVRGITMTQTSADHDVGFTLIGMNPV